MHIESKLPRSGTTVFTVMSQLAVQYGAVNLGQGFPDFSTPQRLCDALAAAMRSRHNQYAPMIGVAELGICGVGAAVANAIYNATGVRVRDYPITLDKLIGRMPMAV